MLSRYTLLRKRLTGVRDRGSVGTLERLNLAFGWAGARSSVGEIKSEPSLEARSHARIRAEFNSSPELREAIGRGDLGAIERCDVIEYQLHRLRRQLTRAVGASAYYRELMARAETSPNDIRALADLDKLPFTTYQDVQERRADMLCMPRGKIERELTMPLPGGDARFMMTKPDVQSCVAALASALSQAGVTKGGNALIATADGNGMTPWGLGMVKDAVRLTGASFTESLTGDLEQFSTRAWGGVTSIIGPASYLLFMARAAEGKTKLDVPQVGIVACTGGMLTSDEAKEVAAAFGAEPHCVLEAPCMSPMGAASCRKGPLHLNEAEFIVEAIDPASQKRVRDGQAGELTWTSLTLEATPLFRFRSGVMGRVSCGPCQCGSQGGVTISPP